MQMGVAPAMLVIEPTGRNTAPVLALRAMTSRAAGGDPAPVAMPADHVIAWRTRASCPLR